MPSGTADATRVAVANEQFAKHYWPGSDAVGKRIRLENGAGIPVAQIAPTEALGYE